MSAEALPKQLALELSQQMSFGIFEKMLTHRYDYLLAKMATPKPEEECRKIWGQIEECRWLLGLRGLAEITLNPENSR